jgi:hypothetical protein
MIILLMRIQLKMKFLMFVQKKFVILHLKDTMEQFLLMDKLDLVKLILYLVINIQLIIQFKVILIIIQMKILILNYQIMKIYVKILI